MDMMDASKNRNRKSLRSIIDQCKPGKGQWVLCPKCGWEWSRLTETGLCAECKEEE